ncbi:MAG: lipid-A-disaccharide synthase [Bacteroidetes bacterium]|uniref:Lipid-A-disaccharide synthase n=1 Tax=Candidatus Cryptobacteroides intestinavium TaxID=2840766 RepID=A0A9D9ESL3_9BACT|nr:lipid-A-disaccharide synthase [Candidatus Cryptobacteroides intestinavium]
MKYYIIAGEASGDLHGSNLMRGLYARDPEAEIRFWGGDLMNGVYTECDPDPGEYEPGHTGALARGMRYGGLAHHYKEGAVMGFWEVIRKGGRLLKNVRECKEDILAHRPDAVILIDYPGFNFRIAEFAHRHGLKVFYYIAPKVWASREGRIRRLKAYVDKLFIVFPFEIPYFRAKGVDFIYKGNPLVDAVDLSPAMKEDRHTFLSRNSLEDKPIIAMLAGSRKPEITSMMPVLTEFARRMHSIPEYSGYQFLIAGAPARSIEDYSPWLDPSEDYIKVLFGETQPIIRNAEAAVVNSGTASLETVLFNVPQVVGYRVNWLTYIVGKHIIKIHYISLGNLCIDRLAFRELIQDDCNADEILKEVRSLLEDRAYRERMLSDYAEIRHLLGGTGASLAVAGAMVDILSGSRPSGQ